MYFLFLSDSNVLPGETVMLQSPQMVSLMALYLQGNFTTSAVLEKVMSRLPFLA